MTLSKVRRKLFALHQVVSRTKPSSREAETCENRIRPPLPSLCVVGATGGFSAAQFGGFGCRSATPSPCSPVGFVFAGCPGRSRRSLGSLPATLRRSYGQGETIREFVDSPQQHFASRGEVKTSAFLVRHPLRTQRLLVKGTLAG